MKKNGQMLYSGAIAMNDVKMSDATKKEAVKAFNKETEKAESNLNAIIDKELAESKKVKEQSVNLEMMPTGTYVLLTVYDKNPWEQLKETDSGLIIPTATGEYKSNKTGEVEVADEAVKFAHVNEVGPEVKFIKAGDDVIFRNHTQLPAPFLGQAFWIVGQGNIITVINEGLAERIKESK